LESLWKENENWKQKILCCFKVQSSNSLGNNCKMVISVTFINNNNKAKLYFGPLTFTNLQFWPPNFHNSTFDPPNFSPFCKRLTPQILSKSMHTWTLTHMPRQHVLPYRLARPMSQYPYGKTWWCDLLITLHMCVNLVKIS
jgi:hypothetical protein